MCSILNGIILRSHTLDVSYISYKDHNISIALITLGNSCVSPYVFHYVFFYYFESQNPVDMLDVDKLVFPSYLARKYIFFWGMLGSLCYSPMIRINDWKTMDGEHGIKLMKIVLKYRLDSQQRINIVFGVRDWKTVYDIIAEIRLVVNEIGTGPVKTSLIFDVEDRILTLSTHFSSLYTDFAGKQWKRHIGLI